MPVRARVLDDARTRSRATRLDLGREIRQARLSSGLRQTDVGAACRHSKTWVSRVERGLHRGLTTDDLIVLGAAVGLRVRVSAFPAERAIHDAAQLALLREFRERVGEAWSWHFEVPVPIPGDRRAADAVLRRGEVGLLVEAFTRLSDGQAQLRAVLLKQRDMRIPRAVILLRESRANRAALTAAADTVAADFPLSTRTVLTALKSGRDPGAGGVVLL